jgi:mannose-6-phosphate isomerase-like protein (cupin superfamily)
MTIESITHRPWSFLIIFLGVVCACTPAPRFFLQYGASWTEADINKILAQNPLAVTANIRVTTLGRGRTVSHHVVQIRDRESPHIHKEHDLTVTVLRGQGYLMLGTRRIDLTVGDVVFIPEGAAHYFVNTDSQPAVALAVFSPPFDGKDNIQAAPGS